MFVHAWVCDGVCMCVHVLACTVVSCTAPNSCMPLCSACSARRQKCTDLHKNARIPMHSIGECPLNLHLNPENTPLLLLIVLCPLPYPGVHFGLDQLEAHDGATIQFRHVKAAGALSWSQNLEELSGGQRTLVRRNDGCHSTTARLPEAVKHTGCLWMHTFEFCLEMSFRALLQAWDLLPVF